MIAWKDLISMTRQIFVALLEIFLTVFQKILKFELNYMTIYNINLGYFSYKPKYFYQYMPTFFNAIWASKPHMLFTAMLKVYSTFLYTSFFRRGIQGVYIFDFSFVILSHGCYPCDASFNLMKRSFLKRGHVRPLSMCAEASCCMLHMQ